MITSKHFYTKIKSLFTQKQELHENINTECKLRNEIYNTEVDSDIFFTIYGRLMNSLNVKHYNLDLNSLYTSHIIEQNLNRVDDRTIQSIYSFKNEFILKLKEKIDFDMMCEFLKNYNYFESIESILSHQKSEITEQFMGLIIRIGSLLSYAKNTKNSITSTETNHLASLYNYQFIIQNKIEQVIHYYIESIDYDGEFNFNEKYFFEKISILKINEIHKTKNLSRNEYERILLHEIKSLQGKKLLMNKDFPTSLNENLKSLGLHLNKILKVNKRNEKLLKECHHSLKGTVIDSSPQTFYNVIRNGNGRLNWIGHINALVYFVHILNKHTSITNNKVYKYMCDNFTHNGKSIPYKKDYKNMYYQKKDDQNFLSKYAYFETSLKKLEMLEWEFKPN
ncbi:hypothetical protein [Marinifilum sp. D737]|uniref:hypothetical protein n=1 Tax=Marinifilum sp. D737 TaxID=2969628 RepID=UPI002276A1D2|nr:hypothetical protein [Marinifilum sp. D737]MCY1633910.1 hypothetical protein [Marinifilum sp. D737]